MTTGPRPLRLAPGTDLRRELESLAAAELPDGGFVLCGIGSLTQARLRYAGRDAETSIDGPLEILTLAGSVSAAGAHLHMSVSDAQGRVSGGHVGQGNLVRTTVELLLAPAPGWVLSREVDPATGWQELVVRRQAEPQP